MSKIGIMGGTFDPIHNGHLKIALAAKSEYHLDKVIFLTSGNPPHKKGKKILDGKIRHIMVKRAIAEIPGFEPSDWEISRTEYSYTLNTLMHFQKEYPGDEIFFIIGGDSARDFHKWYHPEEILGLCTLLVYDRTGGTFSCDFAKPVHGEKIDISSTEIRRRRENGEDISALVPKTVNDFIVRNNIYLRNDSFEKRLESMLTPSRFAHSLGVRDTAVRLAQIHGADVKKAEIAGLLHDNAKNLDNIYDRCRDLEVDLDRYELQNPALVHAKLGAETAKCEFYITDPEILDAIRYHTVGRSGMTLLEKIIFVADLTEPGRDFPDVPPIRELSEKDLDAAVCRCIRSTIRINESRGNAVHPAAYKVLNELKK